MRHVSLGEPVPRRQAALEAMDEAAIADDAEARRLASFLLVGEARVGRVRDRLRHYLLDRGPLAPDGMELGFFPTKGRYDPAAVFRAATEAEVDPGRSWPPTAVRSEPSSSASPAWRRG